MLVSNLIDTELLREDEAGFLYFDASLLRPLAYAELVLPAEARQAMRRLALEKPLAALAQ